MQVVIVVKRPIGGRAKFGRFSANDRLRHLFEESLLGGAAHEDFGFGSLCHIALSVQLAKLYIINFTSGIQPTGKHYLAYRWLLDYST